METQCLHRQGVPSSQCSSTGFACLLNQMTNNQTGNSDGGVSADTDATSIHTVCECDDARCMNPVQQQVRNFIVLEADVLTI